VRLDDLTFRPGTSAEAERCAALFAEGVETYRAFAPAGWAPPSADEEAAHLAAQLDQADVWSLLAEDGPALVGYVAIMPAARHERAVSDPALAHFWQLFVARTWWGTGLAGRLHAEALAAARARGFTAMRLFTAAHQERARRFYEREGWTLATPAAFEARIGLDMVEYRHALTDRPAT
jgi:GNAT superfamily N-acetyltransferase